MAKLTRDQLDIELDNLAAWVPAMQESTAEADQSDAFALRAGALETRAEPADLEHLHIRLQRILSDNCMVPTGDGPCA